MKFKPTRNAAVDAAVDAALNVIIDALGVFPEGVNIKDTVFKSSDAVEIEVYKDVVEVSYLDAITLSLYNDGTLNAYETNPLFRGMAYVINKIEADKDSLENNLKTILSHFYFNKDF